MSRRRNPLLEAPISATTTPTVRCAIYTRKSTDEGLDREFNSLDAQREAAEAYVLSQRQEGWVTMPTRYDDGGFSGGTLDRPALKQLLIDIDAGLIDTVIIYKFDRISRSLVDFVNLVEYFDAHNVALVSITQAVNTNTSMGRLMVNILMSFAEFERAMIAERTKDKMAAARKKGKFVGGTPILGYDLDPQGGKLIVNAAEASIVRELFHLYRSHQGLLAVVKEARRRGWTTKAWVKRDGTFRAGNPFNRSNLHGLLTNVAYIGKVDYEGVRYEGEHEGIVDPAVFDEVQDIMQRQAATHGRHGCNACGALLKGLLICGHCHKAMIPSLSSSHGRKYRYYVCSHSQKHGADQCPTRSVPAVELEAFVVDRMRTMRQDAGLIRDIAVQAQQFRTTRLPELEREQRTLQTQLQERQRAGQHLAALLSEETPAAGSTTLIEQLRAIEAQVTTISSRLDDICEELRQLHVMAITEDDLTQALSLFDPIWDVLYPTEQARIVRLLIEKVDYNGAAGTLGITFRPNGIAILHSELASAQ
ncbi:MAG: recombinase family protein [Armatimonadota bacterium]